MSEASSTELTLVPSTPTLNPTPAPQPGSITEFALAYDRNLELKRSLATIKRCMSAWRRAYKAGEEEGFQFETDTSFWAKKVASKAFCEALPLLSTRENISDFIACAAHGILIDAIPVEKTGPILYAAQLALAALPPEQRRR
jgi:hypothetical protein